MSPDASARIRTVRNHSRSGSGGGRGDGDHRRTGRNDLTVSSQSCLSPAASPGARATITYPYQIVITDWPRGGLPAGRRERGQERRGRVRS